ncbi:hypothetical protein ABW20_dc0104093 [Dactylellina cionopaga]|nr:hypothetical protein ABW20_dc0104093 [Dactylellina cionopaga]
MARTKIIKPASKVEPGAGPQSPVEEVESEHSEFEEPKPDDDAGATTRSNKRKSVSSVKTPNSKKKKRAKVNTPTESMESPSGPKTKYTSRDNTVQEIREIAGSLISNLLGREFPAEAVQFRESKASAKGYSWYVDEGEEFPTCFEREGPMRWLAPERNGVLKMLKEGKLGVEAVMMADDENAAEPPAEGVAPPEDAIIAVPIEAVPMEGVSGAEPVAEPVPDVDAEDKDADK